MKNSVTNNQINLKLQELTERFENLEIKFKKESESIKSDIAILKGLLNKEENSTDEGYITADDGNTISPVPIVPIATKVPSSDEEDDLFKYFDFGSVAQVNNSYKGQYGRVGIVYKKSPKFVYCSDPEGESFHRHPKNLLCLSEDVQQFNKERIQKGKRPIQFKPRKRKGKGKKFW